jgi:hypothetical protein
VNQERREAIKESLEALYLAKRKIDNLIDIGGFNMDVLIDTREHIRNAISELQSEVV